MRSAVLDSGAYDTLIDVEGAYNAARAAIVDGELELIYTHVNVDELAATGDLDRRRHLLFAMVSLGRWEPTGTLMLGPYERKPGDVRGSRLDAGRLGADEDAGIFKALTAGGNLKHSGDALLAVTAAVEDCVLVIRERGDEKLAKRAREQGLEALTVLELLAEFGFGATST